MKTPTKAVEISLTSVSAYKIGIPIKPIVLFLREVGYANMTEQ